MDETKTDWHGVGVGAVYTTSDDHSLPPLPVADRERLIEGNMDETKMNPNWKPETWGGPRPGSGRPMLGGDEDPTVTVTVLMPLSLKRAAIRLGDGNMSRGIREAIADAAIEASEADPEVEWFFEHCTNL